MPASPIQIQFRRGSGGSFSTVKTVGITNPRGYFDARVKFDASGAVRLSWSDPSDPSGPTVYSRVQAITVK
jgi:hypothetical protein